MSNKACQMSQSSRPQGEVEGILSCLRSSASVGPRGHGLTLANARSQRDLGAFSRCTSRCVGADHHPAAERSTPSTQVKAACRLADNEKEWISQHEL